jgi:hypothetical protein
MIEQQLTAMLETITQKVWPLTAPDGSVPPCIIYSRVSSMRIMDLSGPIGVTVSMFRIDVYGTSYLETRAMADQVRAVLDGYTTAALNIRLEQEVDLTDMEDQPRLFRTNIDFKFVHDE